MISGMVSVIIPTHNRSAMLREAVASALAQTYRSIELVIVDDGSTDDTARVLAELSQLHPSIIRWVPQVNAGPGAARNLGLQHAQGEFIQYLDSDDLLEPNKFDLQVAALREHPDAGLAYGITRRINLVTGESKAWARTCESIGDIFPSFLMQRGWDTNAPLWRRATCDRIGRWLPLRCLEDWEHDLRAGMLGVRAVHVQAPGAIVRDHDRDRASVMGAGYTTAIVRDMVVAHAAVWMRMRELGLRDWSYLERFSRKLFWLARLCGEFGLHVEAEAALSMAREMSAGRGTLVLRLYGFIARSIGWQRTVRWSERVRSIIRFGTAARV